MRISELSLESGISKDTIRFYEKAGLLSGLPMKRLDNNYRDYGPAVLNRLRVIGDLKEFGFTLTDITEMVLLYEADADSCRLHIPKMEARIQTLDDKIRRLTAFRNRLQSTLDDCKQDCSSNCSLDKTLQGLTFHGAQP